MKASTQLVLDALADPEAQPVLDALIAARAAPPAPERPPYYTVEHLARVTGDKPKAIRNACHNGELAARKRGGRWLIPAEAADTYAEPFPDEPISRRPARRPGPAPGARVGQALQEAMGLGER